MTFSDKSDDDLLQAMIFNCLVQDQNILEVKDGKAQRYLSYKDGYKNGDNQNIIFTLEGVEGDDVIYEQILGLYLPDKIRFNHYEGASINDPMFSRYIGDKLEDFPIVLEDGGWNENLLISENAIVGEDFVFKRYYKNDWDLLLSSDNGWTMVANCMNVQTDVSVLIEKTISFVKKNFRKDKVWGLDK